MSSNRNEYQWYFLRVKAAGAYGWQPCHLHVPIVLKSGSLNLLEPSGPVKGCNWIALPYTTRCQHSQNIRNKDKKNSRQYRPCSSAWITHYHLLLLTVNAWCKLWLVNEWRRLRFTRKDRQNYYPWLSVSVEKRVNIRWPHLRRPRC
jgi:hypothetical protein